MGFFTRTAMDALMKTSHPEINRRQCWNLHRQGLGPLHRLRTVRFRLPQRLHCAFAGAGAAGYRRCGFRQRYHLDRL